MSVWKEVCAVGDLEDNAVTEHEVGGVKVAVTRAGEEYFVYPLFCPHMDEPLSNGFCDGATVTCSFHMWQWDMRTGETTGEAEVDLLRYPVKVEAGVLHADFETVLAYED
jgi:toluene monooxygenase system ferredoxin subunit